jgi:hypothetical protein
MTAFSPLSSRDSIAHPHSRPYVQVRTIVTDQTFVDRSQRLEEALKSNDCKAYCEEKMTSGWT